MPTQITKSDRYVSFEGIDCDGNAALCIEHITRLAHGPAKGNPFWQQFLQKVARSQNGDTGVGDALFLVHANINVIRELFEDCEDAAAQALLETLEMECC